MLVRSSRSSPICGFSFVLKSIEKQEGERWSKNQKSKKRAQVIFVSEKYDKWSQAWWFILDVLSLTGKGRLTA
jgi:hypothetical protein